MPAPKKTSLKINLLATGDIDKQPLNKFLKWVLLYGRPIIITTELIVIMAFLSRFVLDREITDLHEAIGQKKAIVEATYDLEYGFRNLQERLTTIKSLQGAPTKIDKILGELTKLIPSDVYLTDLAYSEDQITINAVAGSKSGFSKFLNSLKRSKAFLDLKISGVNEGVDKVPGIKFGISMKVIGK